MNEERVINLLASGLNANQVSTIVGCTPARISQLLKDESFALKLRAKEIETNAGDIEEISLTAKYHAAESALIKQVMEMAPLAELRDVTAALRVVGERRIQKEIAKNPSPLGGTPVYNTVIQLSLPNHALPEIAITKQREIISIGERNLAPMTSTGVTNLFKQIEDNKTNSINLKLGEDNELSRIPQSPTETFTATPSEENAEAEFLEAMRA